MSVGSELSFFKEKAEVEVIISKVCSGAWNSSFEYDLSILDKILVKYQEQPQLLGPYIGDLLAPLIERILALVKDMDRSAYARSDVCGLSLLLDFPHLHAVCKVIQLICRVRGFKHVIKQFPHEVEHFEVCMTLLKAQNKDDHSTWETRYVLLLWLSILCLIPFDICSLDSASSSISFSEGDISTSSEKSNLVGEIVKLAMSYLSDTGPTRDAGSLCLSSLMTRPDMESTYLDEFMQWALDILRQWAGKTDVERADLTIDSFRIIGVMHCLAQIYKTGHRSKLLPYAPIIMTPCLEIFNQNNEMMTRKLLTKLFQRIGMSFLPPQLASWRYSRGQRSLNNNLHHAKSAATSASGEAQVLDVLNQQQVEGGEEEDFDIPEEIESIMEVVLASLSDKDNVVRWSAAKGIGRMTMRLSKEFADDIVGAVIDKFSDETSDSNWHGGCLALAELSRRGLLLPSRLDAVIPVVERAMYFDIVRGQHSVGSHVRDAACYVCWAFSRAYSPAVLKPYMEHLSMIMLCTALFDREINCRRAASAALQENVGRQGNDNFPNGIEIITIADYFSLGNRVASFLVLAPKIAKLDKRLCTALVLHLKEEKIYHWDKEIRLLASKSLAVLSAINIIEALPLLKETTSRCTSAKINTRHGALLSTASVLLAMASAGIELPEETTQEITGIIPALEKARLYRSRGGDLVRQAACGLIESIAQANISLPLKLQVVLLESLNEQIRQPHEDIQYAARDALRQLMFRYFGQDESSAPSERLQTATVLKYIQGLNTEENVAATRGYALALGALPMKIAVQPPGRLAEVLACLTEASSRTRLVGGEPDSTTRRNAVESATELLERLVESSSSRVTADDISAGFRLLLSASSDYSIDKRGDTGSWSRIMALKGFERLCFALTRKMGIDENKLVGGALNAPLPTGSIASILAPAAEDGTSTGSLQAENLVGHHVLTALGCGVIESVLRVSATSAVLRVQHPKRSLGHVLSVGRSSVAADHHQSYWITILNIARVKQALFEPTDAAGSSSSSSSCSSSSPVVTSDGIFSVLEGELAVQMFSTILQQLGEKLDSVRDIAGGVLVSLLQNEGVRTPDKAVICEALKGCAVDITPRVVSATASLKIKKSRAKEGVETGAGAASATAAKESATDETEEEAMVADGDDDAHGNDSIAVEEGAEDNDNDEEEDDDDDDDADGDEESRRPAVLVSTLGTAFHNSGSSVVWAQPNQVFPILSSFLRSDLYFHAIISGLIISVGGLTETTAKESIKGLLGYMQHSGSNNSGTDSIIRLSESLLKLFADFTKVERVIVPLVKSIETLLRAGVFDRMAVPQKAEFGASVYAALATETKGLSNVGLLCNCLDVVGLLALFTGRVRYMSVKALTNFLSHKYPRVRKYCAEIFYMLLLSDSDLIGSCAQYIDGAVPAAAAETAASEVKCGFFSSAEAVNEASEFVSMTVWDSADKDAILESKFRLQQMAGIPVDKAAAAAKKAAVNSRVAGGSATSSAGGAGAVADEHDSYEALVREAGY